MLMSSLHKLFGQRSFEDQYAVSKFQSWIQLSVSVPINSNFNIHFRQFLEHFVKERGLEFLNIIPGVFGVYIALYVLVLFVVVLASLFILTYYRYKRNNFVAFAYFDLQILTSHPSPFIF